MVEEMQRRLSLNEAMFYWLQIVDAVDYLHNLRVPVIHKDIKGKGKSHFIVQAIFLRSCARAFERKFHKKEFGNL